MELPNVDASSVVLPQYTDHFTGAIEGWSDAEIITADQRTTLASANQIVESATNILRNALITSANAEREVTQLRARYGIRDIVLDKRILASSAALLNGPAMRDRKHPVFRSVFNDGSAGDITEAKLREEPELAARMRDRFAESPDFEGKTRIKTDLDEALAKSFSTRDALDAAESAERRAGDAELQARIGVRTALDQVYGMLRTAFPGQRKLVESFFYRNERRSRKTNPDESPGNDSP